MSNDRGIGAPKGGRVHWLLIVLPKITHEYYELNYNYTRHCYKFTLRKCEKGREDEYIIMHTSPKRWLVVYHDTPTAFFEQASLKNAFEVLDYFLYRFPEKLRQEEIYKTTGEFLQKEFRRKRLREYKRKLRRNKNETK
jgi:hypothetical protein